MTAAPSSPLGLFGRQVYVEIGPEGGAGVRLADLRVGFKVEHKSSKTVSTATVKIWNPAPTSISLLGVPLAAIRLVAGYATPGLLFMGSPVKGGITLAVEGPDRVLSVDAGDGGRAYASTFVQVALATPTTFGQVLYLVLAQTLWLRGFVDPSLQSVALPHGVVLLGKPSDVMDRLAAAVLPIAADWYIRDGALYVVAKGQATPEVAPLLSSEQGNLIGSPTFVAATPGASVSATATPPGSIKVRALIDATMRPGRAFVVASTAVSGTYVARDVTFTGDSGYENAFYMDLVGRPVGVP